MRNTKITEFVILISIVFLFVQHVSAAEVTLDQGDVQISSSVTESIIINYSAVSGEQNLISMYFDYEQRNTTYSRYVVYNCVIDNSTNLEDIPSVVVQPLKIQDPGMSYPICGNATLKVYKNDYIGGGLSHVDLVFDLVVNETWHRSITSDTQMALFASDEISPTGNSYDNLGEYYGHIGGSDYYFYIGKDNTRLPDPFSDEYGISVYVQSRVLGSDSPYNETNIISSKEFYNEYEIKQENTLGYKRINVTRTGSDYTAKLTNSSVYIINEDYELELQTSFIQDSNTTYIFDNVPCVVWIIAKGMESDGTNRHVEVYNDLGVDTFSKVKGYTYDAETGLVLSGVSVESGTFTDTSNETGYYTIGPVVAENEYTLEFSKTGYQTDSFTVYLPRNEDYTVDVGLIPDSPTYSGDAAILGIVDTLPYYQPLENITVEVSNATWSTTTTTNIAGYYLVDELESASTYWANVSVSGYRYNNASVTTGSYVTHDKHLDPVLSLSVTARDVDTNVLIQSYSATLNTTTQSTNTSATLVFNNLSYGVYELTVTSDTYYPTQMQLFVDSNITQTVYLQRDITAGLEYPAHYVAIKVVNWFGKPLSNVNVTVMNGSTGVIRFSGGDGVAGFKLIQDVYYNLTLTYNGDIQRLSLMPVYTEYTIFFTPSDQVPPQDTKNWYDFVDFNISTQEINSTHAYINLTYVDILSASSNLYIFVNDSDDVNLINSSVNLSVIVNQSQGASFFVGFTCDYTGYDTLSVKKVVIFPWNLGEDSAISEYTREMAAIAFLILLGAVFGTLTVPHGGLILPIFALILNWVGWFTIVNDTTTRMVCLTAITLALMFYMRSREDEVM